MPSKVLLSTLKFYRSSLRVATFRDSSARQAFERSLPRTKTEAGLNSVRVHKS